jgi:hypothetical protein
MLITKQNIKDLSQFTLNIEDRIINPHIEDAQEYDLRPTIGDQMIDKLLADFDGGLVAWDISTNYLTGQFVVYNKTVYKALNNNVGLAPDTNPLDWSLNELGTFQNKYLRPYLVFSTYRRFLLWAGRNVTQYGLRDMREDTSDPVSDESRAALISDMKIKGQIWENRFKNYLCEVNWTFDGVNYTIDCDVYKQSTRQVFKIRPLN